VDVAAVLLEESAAEVPDGVAQKNTPVLGPKAVPHRDSPLADEVEERRRRDRDDGDGDANGTRYATRAATVFDRHVDYRSHGTSRSMTTVETAAFAVLVVLALFALGLLFLVFLKSSRTRNPSA
jgi:hypothetical protein